MSGFRQQLLELVLLLDAAVLADAQEDDAVNGHLHRVIQLALVLQSRVAQGEVPGQRVAPAFDFLQEGIIHLRGAVLALHPLRVLVEGAFQDGVLREDGGDLVPFFDVVLVGQVHHPPGGGLVGGVGFAAAVVDREFLKIGQDRQRQLGDQA